MGLFGNIMDRLKLSREDDNDDYFFDEEDDFDEEEEEKPAKKQLFRRKAESADPAEEEEEAAPRPRFLGRSQQNNVVPMKRSMEVSMVKPNSMDDAKQIGELLLIGKAVVLNMEGLNMDTAQRIIDFTSGATFAIDGNLQKISNYIFIATPKSVELSGDFQEIMASAGSNSFNMRF